MESDSADTNPAHEPSRAKREHRLNESQVYSETRSIALNASVTEVYENFCRFEQIPRFIDSLVNIQKIDDTNFWLTTAHGDGQRRIRLQIVLRVPERRIAWQASCSHSSQGVIIFEPLSQSTTQVTLKLRSTAEPALLAETTHEYLINFKQFVEHQTLW